MTLVCKQTVKPRARQWHMTDIHKLWEVRCGVASGSGHTLDEAYRRWEANRLMRQLYFPRQCK